MKFCKNCGYNLADAEKFCSACGAAQDAVAPPPPPVTPNQGYSAPPPQGYAAPPPNYQGYGAPPPQQGYNPYPSYPPQARPSNKLAIAALVLGIVSLAMLGASYYSAGIVSIVTGILAIVFAGKAEKVTPNNKMAKIGRALGIPGLIVGAIVGIIGFIVSIIYFISLSSSMYY